ncbi:MAG: ABC transporter permease [Actinobacteria bacterium]|nr:ABC transporter permease [Actinomycetota bacterium]
MSAPGSAVADAWSEVRKVGAFVRRDLITAWSYRLGFFADAINLVAQTVVFSFVGKMVDPTVLPSFGGTRATYMGFVALGIALTGFLQVGLGRMVTAIRTEQFMGTLESLLMTPTRQTTLLLGSVAYDLAYVPIRTVLFLAVVSISFGVDLRSSGVLPAAAVVLLFIPFVWGLGIASAAGVLTFRRGAGLYAWFGYGLTLLSGAYFPVDLLPGWMGALAGLNPIAVALDASREALLGGAGWGDLIGPLAYLAASAVLALGAGMAALQLALRRERRLGTVGLY